MSKSSKKASKQRNLAKKQGIKAANKAKYAELRRLGQNSKSKRSKMNGKKSKKIVARHLGGRCGNNGCSKCNPKYAGAAKPKAVEINGKIAYLKRVGQYVPARKAA